MKRLCLLTLLALGLTGLAAAANDNAWVTPQPVKSYLHENNYMATGEFFDLSTAYTENGGNITVNAAAQAYGVQNLMVLGKDLAAGASLNNVFFGYDKDNGAFTNVTRSGNNSQATAFPIQNLLGNTAFSFMEKTVTGFILSAAGGVYLTDATGENVEMTLPDPLAGLKNQEVQYAARGFIAKYTPDAAGNYAAVLNSVPITKTADKPVCHIALCQDNISGLMYFLVQYNLLVNNHTLVYQIQIADDGRVEYRIGQQDKTTKTPEDDDYYTFRIDLKRNTDTISFGGTATYVMSPVQADNEKTAWVCNTAQSLEKHRLSVYPKGGVINGVAAYTSINANITLSAKSQEAVNNATGLLVIATPQSSVTPDFENKAYAVGDEIANAQNARVKYPVVYSGKPAAPDDISFTVNDLNPNETYYLYAFLCKQDGTDYHYSADVFVFSNGLKTTPMETPADVTVGELNGDNIPLTFRASPFRLLVMKSDSVQTAKPQGVLTAGDRDGKVIAVLEKNVTSCNIPMAPGEMTYLQIYAMTDDDIPGYSSNFTLVPLYRQAETLPLRYTFGYKDEILNQPEDAMPMLPPGLSTDMTDPDEAFSVTYPDLSDHTFYLLSRKVKQASVWPHIILPAFSGSEMIQATFTVKFYKTDAHGKTNTGQPDQNDSIRIEYRLNDETTWRTAGVFGKGNMPEPVGTQYTLGVVLTCEKTDVVSLRYRYTAESNINIHAIVSYELLDIGGCETPSGLQMVNDGTTDKTLALKWTDNNLPLTGRYLLSYQKAGADDWQTLTVKRTDTVLSGLDPKTAYNFKVQAVCGFSQSNETAPVRIITAAGLPYSENMACIYNEEAEAYSTMPVVTVYKGAPGATLQEEDYTNTSATWNTENSEAQKVDFEDYDADALAVSTYINQALLALPAIYARQAGAFLPKTLTFKVNTYALNTDGTANDGIDLTDPALRLYVLATTNGNFKWSDTIAAFDRNALKAESKAPVNTNRGKDLSVSLDQFEGLIRIAFYFHNPNASEANDPMYLELLNASFRYEGDDIPCFPIKDLKTSNRNETDVTLRWKGEGEEYGITYYPAGDRANAKTVYQDATAEEEQTVKLEGLTSNTAYVAEVVSYCTKGDHDYVSRSTSVEFKTLRELFEVAVTITPDESGIVTGDGSYFEGGNVKLIATANEGYTFVAWKDGETELSKDTVYTFNMPNRHLAYTAVFELNTGIEDAVKAGFSLSTDNGLLIVRNLNGIMVKDIDVYSLTGNRINRFVPNSREDLMLPLDAERALLIVRLNTEMGAATYKIYAY